LRYVGIAAFRGPELLDWGVKSVTGKTPPARVKAARLLVRSLTEEYCPDVLALKRLHRSRSSARLRHLVRQIKSLAKRRGIKLRQYSIQDLKAAIIYSGARASKRTLASLLAARYPALAYDLQQESEHRNPYRVRMFEAVALAVVCWQEIENK
jgi:hypothetical protein